MRSKSIYLLFALFFLLTSGCASSAMKQRKEQRDKVAQSSKMFCEFINGDIYPDIEVALNLEMAKRCDPDKNFTMTEYKTRNETSGIVFCCSLLASARVSAPEKSEVKEVKKESKKSEAKASDTKTPPAKDDEELQ